jgi:DnaJ-class molecular chaperone
MSNRSKRVKPMPEPITLFGHEVNWTACNSCEGKGWYVFSSSHYDSEEACETCKCTGWVPDKETQTVLRFIKARGL